METSLKGLRNLAKAVYNVATLVVGGGIVTPLLNTMQGRDNDALCIIPSVFIYGIAIVLYTVGYMIDCYADSKEQLSHSARHRKHRIRIPKNTTIGVEVEE